MTAVLDTINSITQDWFLSEPMLFSCFCTHELVEKKGLRVPFRTGRRKIEYCPEVLEKLGRNQIAEYLKIEVFRILLKHPYQRQPSNSSKAVLTAASDAVIYANYDTDVQLVGISLIKELVIRYLTMSDNGGMPDCAKSLTGARDENGNTSNTGTLSGSQHVIKKNLEDYLLRRNGVVVKKTSEYVDAIIDGKKFRFESQGIYEGDYYKIYVQIEKGNYSEIHSSYKSFWGGLASVDPNGKLRLSKSVCFEEYCAKLNVVLEYSTDTLSEQSELWEEDSETLEQINHVIDEAEKSEQWGSVSGDIAEVIRANRKVSMNYAEILRHFGTSVLSTRRTLTRMKPNRRFGFERLGSKYKLKSNLLVAVDLSSSITKENLEYVFSIVNRFFRYGVEKIDVVQFDSKIEGDIVPMSRAIEFIKLNGRGGTEFQPVVDFYSSHTEYDGLILFTDGFGPHPVFDKCRKPQVMWIFTSKDYYDKGCKWTNQLPGNISTWIPLPFGGH